MSPACCRWLGGSGLSWVLSSLVITLNMAPPNSLEAMTTIKEGIKLGLL